MIKIVRLITVCVDVVIREIGRAAETIEEIALAGDAHEPHPDR
jgi:hypothetical protein